MTITCIVKGNKQQIAEAAGDRGILFRYLGEFDSEWDNCVSDLKPVRKTIIQMTDDHIVNVADWFKADNFVDDGPLPIGTLLEFNWDDDEKYFTDEDQREKPDSVYAT